MEKQDAVKWCYFFLVSAGLATTICPIAAVCIVSASLMQAHQQEISIAEQLSQLPARERFLSRGVRRVREDLGSISAVWRSRGGQQ